MRLNGLTIDTRPSGLVASLIALTLVVGMTLNAQWINQESGTNQWLRSVTSMDSLIGIVVGDSGVILRTTDGGNLWSRQVFDPKYNFYSVSFVNRQTVRACGLIAQYPWPPGFVIESIDEGETWHQLATADSLGIFDMTFPSEMVGWFVAAQYPTAVILKSTNGGASSVKQYISPDTELLSVCFVDTIFGWTAGSRNLAGPFTGVVASTTDGGSSWTDISLVTGALSAISFVNRLTGWVTSFAGTILRSTDGGQNWAVQYFDSTASFNDVQFLDSLHGVVVGFVNASGDATDNHSIILSTIDGGITWNSFQAPEASILFAASMNKDSSGWVVGAGGQFPNYQGIILKRNTQMIANVDSEWENLGVAPTPSIYPNPFNSTTRVSYILRRSGPISIRILNILGEQVADLEESFQNAGSYNIGWDARSFASGMYILSIQSLTDTFTAKLLYVK